MSYVAKAHPQQVSRRWPDDVDAVDDRATHPLDFADFAEQYGPFTLDVAAAAHNRKCERYLTRQQDALSLDWTNPPLWIGPPCFMCDGSGHDRHPAIDRCRACNGHGRKASATLVWDADVDATLTYDPDLVRGGLFG